MNETANAPVSVCVCFSRVSAALILPICRLLSLSLSHLSLRVASSPFLLLSLH